MRMMGNNAPSIMWIGRHEGLLRDISRGVAYGNAESIRIAAYTMRGWLPDASVLVPMPSHIGYATTALMLCRALKRLNRSYSVVDALRCEPHSSSHGEKLEGRFPVKFLSFIKDGVDIPSGAYIIDNYIGTGTTALSALAALPDATVFALTKR